MRVRYVTSHVDTSRPTSARESFLLQCADFRGRTCGALAGHHTLCLVLEANLSAGRLLLHSRIGGL